MSTLEIVIIVGVCLIPIIALVLVLPKSKKDKKVTTETKKDDQNKTVQPENKDEPKPLEENKAEIKDVFREEEGIDTDDFDNFLKNRQKKSTMPTLATGGNEGFPFETEFMPRPRNAKSNKSLAEQIEDLTPEMKACLFAGLLDKKSFDD